MAAVIVGARPIGCGIVTVRGEIGDAAGVVVGLAEGVLNLARKKPGWLAAKSKFERIRFLVAVGLHLAILAESSIRAIYEGWKRGSIGVNGAE